MMSKSVSSVAVRTSLTHSSGTPKAIIDRINRNINDILKTRDMQERMVAAGFEVGATSVAEFDAYVKRDFVRYFKVIRDANIRAD